MVKNRQVRRGTVWQAVAQKGGVGQRLLGYSTDIWEVTQCDGWGDALRGAARTGGVRRILVRCERFMGCSTDWHEEAQAGGDVVDRGRDNWNTTQTRKLWHRLCGTDWWGYSSNKWHGVTQSRNVACDKRCESTDCSTEWRGAGCGTARAAAALGHTSPRRRETTGSSGITE